MDFGLKKRTALVTGSSQGIGKVIAIALAKEGCNVILCARNLNKLKKTVDEIESLKTGVDIRYYCFDATVPDEVRHFFSGHIRSLDILVNNVGGGTGKPLGLFGLTESEWLEMYKLNVLSMIWFTENALPFLEKSSQARIINISSATSHQPGLYNPHYGAAKSAMDFLSKRIANELASKRICVNTIGPHAVTCENWERDVRDRAEICKVSLEEARATLTRELIEKIPMNRQGTSEDIANLVIYLASVQANFITGTYIPVDGGTLKARP